MRTSFARVHSFAPRVLAAAAMALLLAACGAKTGLRVPDVTAPDAVDIVDVPPEACMPVLDRCASSETCGNGEDDDCNGQPDDGCPCTPGEVQPCFAANPARRHVGACRDGEQVCGMNGFWGRCTGGIVPQPDVCNGTDNLCTGCSEQRDCPIMCPSPDDARIPAARPFQNYLLHGRDFYPGPVQSWRWLVEGGPCDQISIHKSFTLADQTSETATFFPTLSGDYRVTLTVITPSGQVLECTWVVHVQGPGLRVEMCYPENTIADNDLYLHRPGNTEPWFPTPDESTSPVFNPTPNASCNWSNCEPHIRGTAGRVDWGYAPTLDLSQCDKTLHGDEWRALGYCGNPRLDLDNNLDPSEGIGLPENINIDHPNEGETFRIMVQAFSGRVITHPLVNVYCNGRRMATYGAPPDQLADFEGDPQPFIGAMWRVADVTTHLAADGTTTCTVAQVHPPGETRGYDITQNDPRF